MTCFIPHDTLRARYRMQMAETIYITGAARNSVGWSPEARVTTAIDVSGIPETAETLLSLVQMTPQLITLQWRLNHPMDNGKRHTWRDFIALDGNHYFDVFYDEGERSRPDAKFVPLPGAQRLRVNKYTYDYRGTAVWDRMFKA